MESIKQALSRDAILAPRELKRETVAVPEFDGTVVIQELTATERDAFEASCVKRKGKKTETDATNFRAKLVVQSARDETGARLFADTDVDAIGKLSASAINRLFEVACRLSGLTDTEVEELAGN